MIGNATLDATILVTMRHHTQLAPLMEELAAAQRHGNLDRVGNAAYEAQAKADALAHALSVAFAMAAELSAATYDGAQAPSPALRLASG